ncbi:MAG: heparinase II/III domain-containing protein, partial [Anaerolineae bacterium]
SPATPIVRDVLRQAAPDLTNIPQTTYTLYRQFEHSGERRNYERPYFAKRTMLTRAVFEMLLGDDGYRDAVHDLLWSICEETSWVLPAHEEQGPDYWDLKPSPRQRPFGAHTALTREPDAIDLFAAETGASLAETVHLVGGRLAPEVVQRVRQEVERRIFKPYLAYGRRHWWYKAALNWNGVCNGAVALAFLRLERDPQTLVEAIEQALEGFEAYIATGFEADGGSIEGIGYWNYGLMYYVTVAELLRERTGGRLDLLAAPRLRDIARYPLAAALSPGRYLNFGDAEEATTLAPGIVQRLAERTGVAELRALANPPEVPRGRGVPTAKLAIVVRDAAWWDGETRPFPRMAQQDAYLPDSGVIRLVGQTADGRPMALATKAGHNDGHHSHTDVATFIYHVDGESLICDPGRGKYSKDYFRQGRYKNVFCNSFGHSVPVIGGRLQAPGPEFGGRRQYHGVVVACEAGPDEKRAVVEFQRAYDLPALTLARRTLRLDPATGDLLLEDE